MYILQNAWKSISRNKGRNLLIGIVALVIATSACVALSIREAAKTAKEDALKSMSVTAQISFDRSQALSDMKNQNKDSGEKFDPSQLSRETMSLSDYMTYTKALSDDDGYYYTLKASLNASGDIEAYEEEEEETTEESSSFKNMMPGGMGGGQGGGGMSFASIGDFSLTGYSSYDAMLSFGEDGTCKVTSGQSFDTDSSDYKCLISNELALYNDLEVGDKITLCNPNCEDETYALTVCGIYTNSASDEGSSRFSRSDPANNIYLSAAALSKIVAASEKADNTMTDNNDEEVSAVLTSETNFTYIFPSVNNYNAFVTAVEAIGLKDNYAVSSTDLETFESSITPLQTLSDMAGWFFLVVIAVGGIILVVINIFNLRERKYEIGVLTAIGMKKRKVATQFVCELLCITFIAILIGAAAGAAVSVPVTNTLLENQISSAETSSENVAGNFGFSPEDIENGNVPSFGGGPGGMSAPTGGNAGTIAPPSGIKGKAVEYIDSVNGATDLTVILELVLVGIFLTILSSLSAMVTIMRYEPLKILSSRT